MRSWIAGTSFLAMVALPAIGLAQVYKCPDPNGRTTYSDAPCAGSGKALAVPESTPAGSVHPSVCAQLLDETQRLAAEAAQDARRGRPKNAANARRRLTLVSQYEQRCAAVVRSKR